MGTWPCVTFEGQWERTTSLSRSYLVRKRQENSTAKQQPRQEHQLVPSYHTPTCGQLAVSHEDEREVQQGFPEAQWGKAGAMRTIHGNGPWKNTGDILGRGNPSICVIYSFSPSPAPPPPSPPPPVCLVFETRSYRAQTILELTM